MSLDCWRIPSRMLAKSTFKLTLWRELQPFAIKVHVIYVSAGEDSPWLPESLHKLWHFDQVAVCSCHEIILKRLFQFAVSPLAQVKIYWPVLQKNCHDEGHFCCQNWNFCCRCERLSLLSLSLVFNFVFMKTCCRPWVFCCSILGPLRNWSFSLMHRASRICSGYFTSSASLQDASVSMLSSLPDGSWAIRLKMTWKNADEYKNFYMNFHLFRKKWVNQISFHNSILHLEIDEQSTVEILHFRDGVDLFRRENWMRVLDVAGWSLWNV